MYTIRTNAPRYPAEQEGYFTTSCCNCGSRWTRTTEAVKDDWFTASCNCRYAILPSLRRGLQPYNVKATIIGAVANAPCGWSGQVRWSGGRTDQKPKKFSIKSTINRLTSWANHLDFWLSSQRVLFDTLLGSCFSLTKRRKQPKSLSIRAYWMKLNSGWG